MLEHSQAVFGQSAEILSCNCSLSDFMPCCKSTACEFSWYNLRCLTQRQHNNRDLWQNSSRFGHAVMLTIDTRDIVMLSKNFHSSVELLSSYLQFPIDRHFQLPRQLTTNKLQMQMADKAQDIDPFFTNSRFGVYLHTASPCMLFFFFLHHSICSPSHTGALSSLLLAGTSQHLGCLPASEPH